MRKLIFLLLLPISCLAQKNYTQLLKEYMQEQVKEGFTGAVLIVKNDKVLLRAGYGMANMEWNMPNGPGVKYDLASVSKQFTAFCIMKLAEEGKLSLDDKLSRFVPDFPKGDSVTIQMLLTHTSGILNFNYVPEYANMGTQYLTKDSLIRLAAKQPYSFSPGARFEYSNTGYFLLTYIVEKASGETFRRYLRNHILDPLGLHDTNIDADDSVVSHMAQGYQMTGDGLLHCEFIDKHLGFGVCSTIDDLYAWEKAYTTDAVLTEASRKMIFSTAINHPNYGFGIRIDTFMNHRLFWHTGDGSGFDSYVGRFVDDGTYVILLSNDQFIVQRMKDEIGHILFDSPEYFAAQRAKFKKQLSEAKNELDKKRAIWQLNKLKAMESTGLQVPPGLSADTGTFGFGWHFFVRDNALYCRGAVRDNNLILLKHVSEDLFQRDETQQVAFKKNSAGLVVGIDCLFEDGTENFWPSPIELEKNKTTWQNNKAKAGQQPMPDSAVLSPYAGTYDGGLVFSLQGSNFIFRNAGRGEQPVTLRYISAGLFQLDENNQVEFVKGQDGTITAVKLLLSWGLESIRDKIR